MRDDMLFPDSGRLVAIRLISSIRWLALAGQVLALLVVHIGLGFDLPVMPAAGVIMVSVLVGLWHAWYHRRDSQLTHQEVLLLLGYDTIQLAALLYLTGGLINPFAIMFLAPVTVSASVLRRRETVLLVLLVATLASLLSVYHLPLPWAGEMLVLPPLYIIGLWIALVLTTLFIGLYAGIVATEARLLAKGLAEARLTLAREQQMVALGSLATAAAHKLGSPLNTITLIAHDLSVDRDPAALAEDIRQLKEETERCRTILAGLNEDAVHPMDDSQQPLPVSALLDLLIDERMEDIRPQLLISRQPLDESSEPLIRRRPELFQALETLLDNAAQFARSKVEVVLAWSEEKLEIHILDDGPGFPSAMLPRLGEPYTSNRAGSNGHMGLGVFIAVTMTETVGGTVRLQNRTEGGAEVIISYPRRRLEA